MTQKVKILSHLHKRSTTAMGLVCRQVQNKPGVSRRLARSSLGVCSPPLGAYMNDCLKGSGLKQTPQVNSRG